MKINSNICALSTLTNLSKANDKAATAMERLSSGLRINKSSDDAAGLAIARKLNTQVKGLEQANRNAMDGISLAQSAEGALNEVHSMLQRMNELCVQASNGTLKTSDAMTVQEEIKQLVEQIQDTQSTTEFNKLKLLSSNQAFVIHIGANKNQCMSIDAGKINLTDVVDMLIDNGAGDTQKVDVSTFTNAQNSINIIQKAVNEISAKRSYLGACQNRLEYTVSNLQVSSENTTSALSRIEDSDMAEEMVNYTQQNVITQAASAMLSQANQMPQQVLQLLK